MKFLNETIRKIDLDSPTLFGDLIFDEEAHLWDNYSDEEVLSEIERMESEPIGLLEMIGTAFPRNNLKY